MEIPRGADLRGARLVECDLRGARLVGCEIDDLRIDAFAGDLGSVVVEGVEVGDWVRAELDRRHPERVAVWGLPTTDNRPGHHPRAGDRSWVSASRGTRSSQCRRPLVRRSRLT